MIGKTVAQYKVLLQLGQGGMGIVYKAEDTKLGRNVALKFLPPHLSTSEQDKARFLQEARAASALNHPNVCTIHDILEHDGQTFIVMEYVDGFTLRDRPQPYTIKQVVEIGIQIADGLAAAHEQGIVHRDIKTENIMVRRDGIVQIMDFGLAKLRGASRLTKEGSTLGTVGYMSPEQVQGLDADHRTDIFSLGVVLYELIGGQMPYRGAHETAIMYEIVNVDPAPLSAIRPDVDPELDRIVLECLQKDPDERCQSAKEVSRDLRRFKVDSGRKRVSRISTIRPVYTVGSGQVATDPGIKTASSAANGSPRRGKLSLFLPWAVAVLAIAALALGLLLRPSPGVTGNPAVRFVVETPKAQDLEVAGSANLALSPDGTRLVIVALDSVGVSHLWIRTLDAVAPRVLPGTDGAWFPFWSPDNRFLGFFAERKLKKIDVTGGPPLTICDATDGRGGTWNSQGVIVFSPDATTGLFRVSAAGGIATLLTRLDTTRVETTHRWPWFLPDGNHFLYYARSGGSGTEELDALYAGSLDSSSSRVIMPHHGNAIYARGHLIFAREGTLMAQSFDPARLLTTGDPFAIGEDILHDARFTNDAFTASSSGTLAYRAGTGGAGTQLIWYDRAGRPLDTLDAPAQYVNCRLSPDNKRLAVDLGDEKSNKLDIWIFDLARRVKTRFTFNSDFDEWLPTWSPDGARIAYAKARGSFLDIYVKPSTGAGSEEPLLIADRFQRPTDWSANGRFILYRHRDSAQTLDDVWILPLDPTTPNGARVPRPFENSRFDEDCGVFSPDGRWIAYSSDESGRYEIYVKPFPGPGGKWQVSTKSGSYPVWRHDGKEIFYITDNRMLTAVSVNSTGGAFEVGEPQALFSTNAQGVFPYDVSSDGQRFIIITPVGGGESSPRIMVVLNWDAEVSKK